jgi:hypothetical protein
MWFYELDGLKYGPVNADTIEKLLRDGSIDEVTLVRREGEDTWRHLDETDLIWVVQSIVESDAEEADDGEDEDSEEEYEDEESDDVPAEPTWYYAVDDKVYGPVTAEEINEMRKHGMIDAKTTFSEDGLNDWKPLDDTGLTFTQLANTDNEEE